MTKEIYDYDMGEAQSKSCLIVGCGYVGKELASCLLKNHWLVSGIVRSESSQKALSGMGLDVIQGDITDATFWSEMSQKWDAVIYCPSTGGGGLDAYRAIHDRALSYCLEWLPQEARLLYTSSTSVYGQNDGSWVDETSALNPSTESAQVLLQAERMVCQAGHIVLRLGGIYGPGRGVLLKRLKEGNASIPEQDPKWLNLIHLTDIVGAIRHALEMNIPSGEVYNVIDNEPASYRTIYEWLCDRLELPVPATGTPDYFGKRGISNKRVSNRKLVGTGWELRYPDFRAGYEAELD